MSIWMTSKVSMAYAAALWLADLIGWNEDNVLNEE